MLSTMLDDLCIFSLKTTQHRHVLLFHFMGNGPAGFTRSKGLSTVIQLVTRRARNQIKVGKKLSPKDQGVSQAVIWYNENE